MKKYSRTKFSYEPGETVGMVNMWWRKEHMYAEEDNIAVFAWPLMDDWYPSEQGSKMLDKLWEIAFSYDLAVKV